MQIEIFFLEFMVIILSLLIVLLFKEFRRIKDLLMDLQIDIALYDKMKRELRKQKSKNKIIKVGKWIK